MRKTDQNDLSDIYSKVIILEYAQGLQQILKRGGPKAAARAIKELITLKTSEK